MSAMSWQVATLADGIGWWTRCTCFTWNCARYPRSGTASPLSVDDDCGTACQWTVTNALAWAPQEVRAELTREVEEEGPGAFDAQITLREFDARVESPRRLGSGPPSAGETRSRRG